MQHQFYGMPSDDTGHNTINAEALLAIRDKSCLAWPNKRFNLESTEFFGEVLDYCKADRRQQAVHILLNAGVKPTLKTFKSVIGKLRKETLSPIAAALFTVIVLSQPDLGKRFNQLVRSCCTGQELAELVVILSASPELADRLIDGVPPLTVASWSKDWTAVGILTLYGASPFSSSNFHNSPLVVAVNLWKLDLARVMINFHPSPLDSGWEWYVLKALAAKDFAAPSEDVDCIVRKIGILYGLRLAIENRHERLTSFMLWRFKVESRGGFEEAGSSEEVLEMALQSGICREYVEYVKTCTPRPLRAATAPRGASAPIIDSEPVSPPAPSESTTGWAVELEGLEFT